MRVPGMLHGAMVMTDHPRAKILKIHTEEAAAMPGVVRVFTAADVPGNRGTGLNDPDQPVFVAEGELTCCVADFLAMVVADTRFHARRAAAAVTVDYEVLEPLTDPFAALEPGAPLVHSAETFAPRSSNVLQPTTAFARGDVDAALATAAHVIEATFDTQPIDIAFLEPEACLVVPGEHGVKVHTQSQGSVYDHAQIARILNLDPEDVEIALAASGGAFGAKEELSIQGQTAVAAFLLQRPVKTLLTRPQSTQHHVKRHAMTVKLTVGADEEGRLLALRSRIVADAGGYHTTSAKCALRAACHSTGVYRIPNVDVEAKAVYTNNPNAGAMRGFGSNQAQFAMEGVMDILAGRVGVDGWDIRDRNILNPGDEFGTGQVMRESVRGIRETLEAVKTVYKSATYKGIGCGIKSTGLGNGTIEGGYIVIRVIDGRTARDSQRLHGNGPGCLHRDAAGGVRGDRSPGGHHDHPVGQGSRRKVRRDVGVAGDDVELRGGAAGGAETGRGHRGDPPARRTRRPDKRSSSWPAASTTTSASTTSRPGRGRRRRS